MWDGFYGFGLTTGKLERRLVQHERVPMNSKIHVLSLNTKTEIRLIPEHKSFFLLAFSPKISHNKGNIPHFPLEQES